MYTDEEKNRIPIRTFIISLVVVIIFVLLLMWLLPIPTSSNSGNNVSCKVGEKCEKDKIDLSGRIFTSNLQEMKNAALFYFTRDKLPVNIGESTTITLEEMLNAKVMHKITDKDGNSCDTKTSYVNLEKKQEDSYEIKVNLRCGDEERHTISTVGCYSYCPNVICENRSNDKKDDGTDTIPEPEPEDNIIKTDPVCSLYVSKGKTGENGWYIGDVTVKFKTKRATTEGATIVAYGLGLNDTPEYNENSVFVLNTDGIKNVYGYVKDSDGNTSVCSISIKRDTEKPSCQLDVLSGTKGATGNYISDLVVGFVSKTDATGEVSNYGILEVSVPLYNNISKTTVTKVGKHKIYGFVKDEAGNTNTCDITVIRENAPGEVQSTPSCSLKVTNGTMGKNGWYVDSIAVGFASKESTNKATITAYGIGTSETYAGNSSYTINNDGNNTVYGYVKDSNGNVATCSLTIKKDASKPTCSLKVMSGTYNSSGVYTSNIVIGFDSKADKINEIDSFGIGLSETYKGNTAYTISKDGTTTVYGYVKDRAGNTGSCSIKIEKGSSLEYQYKKEIANQYSDWSNWKTSTYSSNNPPKFEKGALLEMEDLGQTQVVDYYKETLGDAIYQNKLVKVGTVEQRYCKGYDYYRDINNTNTTLAVKQGSGWQYAGKIATYESPSDSITTKYEFTEFDWSCDGCLQTPRKIWKVYTRTVSIATSQNTITTVGVTETCPESETKKVEIFNISSTFVGYETRKEPVYKYVYSYRSRTRSLLKKAYTDYQWSIYNDTNLLNSGYVYTGNTRIAV